MPDYLGKCNYMNLGCATCSPIGYDSSSRGYDGANPSGQMYRNHVSVNDKYSEALKSQ
jgi:hypothetical protein